MEDDGRDVHQLDLENADQVLWMMKSPVVVAKTWEKLAPPPSSSYSSYPSPGFTSLAKVVQSVDFPLTEPKVLDYNLRILILEALNFHGFKQTLDCRMIRNVTLVCSVLEPLRPIFF